MPPSSNVTLRESFRKDLRLAFYERHKEVAKIMILVVFALPLVGVYISGLLGAAVATIISISAYFLALYFTLKFRHQ